MHRLACIPLLFALILLPAFADEPEPSPAEEPSDDTLWQQIRALYESAKEAGEIEAGSVTEWIQSDYQSMGDWEYKVIQVKGKESLALEAELNALGRERWEVFWVREGSGDFTFFLKRPAKSYLRSIPLGDLLKLIPGGGSGGE